MQSTFSSNTQVSITLSHRYDQPRFSGKLRKIIKKEKIKSQIRKTGIEINDFLVGSDGFELFSRFCYSNGEINIFVSNVSHQRSTATVTTCTEPHMHFIVTNGLPLFSSATYSYNQIYFYMLIVFPILGSFVQWSCRILGIYDADTTESVVALKIKLQELELNFQEMLLAY
ncbi:unnamed protein product [Lactuca saligna]|uniref:Uncharacterized protein n=1 Tax=Lactuca saligna TaxID=75948 RepID=A0AA35URS4_LACSI|nr:unnamed protein product [Lactuca saligna]